LRVAVFMPRPTPFYVALLYGMKRGLENNGAEVFASASLFDEDSLLELCRQFRPHLVVEMNRTRSHVPSLPSRIVHAAWIVDLIDQNIEYYSGSDITYFFCKFWRDCFDGRGRLVDWLSPGVCEVSYPFRERLPLSDFSFVGHIPKPWNQSELAREIYRDRGCVIRFGQLHDELLTYWKNNFFELFSKRTYYESACHYVLERYGKCLDLSDQSLRYDLACRMIRMWNRNRLMSLPVASGRSLRIYGSPNWRDWPLCRPYYRRFVASSSALCGIYQTTKLNLHEGVAPHFRVMDSMAAGGVICVMRSPGDDCVGSKGLRIIDSMEEIFEPFVHYLPFDNTNFADITEKYLQDTKARQAVSANAAREVMARHTWNHRATKIIDDYYSVR